STGTFPSSREGTLKDEAACPLARAASRGLLSRTGRSGLRYSRSDICFVLEKVFFAPGSNDRFETGLVNQPRVASSELQCPFPPCRACAWVRRRPCLAGRSCFACRKGACSGEPGLARTVERDAAR